MNRLRVFTQDRPVIQKKCEDKLLEEELWRKVITTSTYQIVNLL